MRVHRKVNLHEFSALVTQIQCEISEWKSVNITVHGLTNPKDIMPVAQQVENGFGTDCIGNLFICGQNEILALARLGTATDHKDIQIKIERSIKNYKCAITTTDITEHNLHDIKSRVNELTQIPKNSNIDDVFYKERIARKRNKFFVIDDSIVARKFLSRALMGAGNVMEFSTPQDAIDSYLREMPDIVFSDVQLLGNISGLDLLEKLKSYDDGAHIVLLSTHATKEKVNIAKELGAEGFLIKPFSTGKVYEMLMRCKTIKMR